MDDARFIEGIAYNRELRRVVVTNCDLLGKRI